MDVIFHITTAVDWHAAEQSGEYTLSTRGRTLQQEGFIHCSTGQQVEYAANTYYAGVNGLVLLAIDRRRVVAPVRDEISGPGNERFPHIYGPLNTNAIIAALPLQPLADGRFVLPQAAAQYM